MKICFIMYPWERVNPAQDSTLRIIHEAVKRGHEVSITHPSNLTIRDSITLSLCKKVVPQENITVKAISIYAQIAPTGQDLKIDFLKNGADQNNPGVLADGKQFEKTDLSSAIGYLKSDRMGLKFSQVGSNVSGDKIVVTVYYQKEAIKT